jgi:hypothetical protein
MDMTAANVQSRWISGNLRFIQKYANGTASVQFDGVPLTLSGDYTVTGFNGLSSRYELSWQAGQRGKPGINADINSATESVREIADPDFEVLGTNGTSALSTYYAEGGITFTTAGADNDQMILVPHLDANQSAWEQVTWGTDQETIWECALRTTATITSMTIWAGLKLTNTSVTATDNDQAFFRYAAATNSGKWQAIHSIGGTNTATDTGIAVAASTVYRLRVAIDASRIARFYINGVLVSTSTALTDATDLKPYVGVQANTGAARSIYIIGQAISRKVA